MNDLFKKLDDMFGWDGYEVMFLPRDGMCAAQLDVYKIEDQFFMGTGCNREVALIEAIGKYEARMKPTAAVQTMIQNIKDNAEAISEDLRRLNRVGIGIDFYLQDGDDASVIKLYVNPSTEEHIPISIGKQGNLRVEMGE